jgi:hypothetical protein
MRKGLKKLEEEQIRIAPWKPYFSFPKLGDGKAGFKFRVRGFFSQLNPSAILKTYVSS